MPSKQDILAKVREEAKADFEEICKQSYQKWVEYYENLDSLPLEPEPNVSTGDKRRASAIDLEAERMLALPKIQKREQNTDVAPTPATTASASKPAKSGDTSSSNSRAEREPPKWYRELSNKDVIRRSGDKTKSGADTSLGRLKDHIAKCKKPQAPRDQANLYQEVRERLHTLAFEQVDEILLRRNRMLHNDSGLPQIFDERYAGKANWPWDIKADAEELYNKWAARQFDTDLLKGIIRGKKLKNRNGKVHGSVAQADSTVDKLEPSAVEKYALMETKMHGNGALLNGQWWPTQLATMRDGAHGHSIAGISGKVGEGAFSVIIAGGVDGSGQPYPNIDNGDEIQYCGTDSTTGTISDGTTRLIESQENGKPVRLIRSHNLRNDHAPNLGFRYDGLYQVVATELMDPGDSKRQRRRFKMVRLAGQDPVRGGDGPEKRPTEREVQEYNKDKRLRGK